MPNIKQEMSNHLANGLGATAGASGVATGFMGFFDSYAAGIGAIFTILTFVTWVFFQLRHDKKLSLADVNKDEIESLSIDFESHKQDTKKEFEKISNKVDSGIESIISKLDKQG